MQAMKKPIRLLIVDDHPLARQGLVSMLNAFDDQFLVVGQAASSEEALIVATKVEADVLLTDLHLGPGDTRSGIDLITRLLEQQPSLACVMLTSELGGDFMLKAHDAGAQAYLSKHASASEIARAIEAVASGFTHFPASLKVAQEKRNARPSSTVREVSLLPYIARGMTAKEIARELTHVDPASPITDRTVEVHKGNIKRKFSLDSANALITFAIEHCHTQRIDYKNMTVHTKPPV